VSPLTGLNNFIRVTDPRADARGYYLSPLRGYYLSPLRGYYLSPLRGYYLSPLRGFYCSPLTFLASAARLGEALRLAADGL
jgi:hypothetical protein